MSISNAPLGKKNTYINVYQPDLLFPIARVAKRKELNISMPLPFYGYDLWNHYEVSWLNLKGKPQVAMLQIIYDCASPKIIESKSMKLYFNSFNNTPIADENELKAIITKDLSQAVGREVIVIIQPLIFDTTKIPFTNLINLDGLDIDCVTYQVNQNLLMTENVEVQETLESHLLKSNCLVTNQPDWGSIYIAYKGNRINHENLLKYIISFRDHNEFHEQCVERIFMDIMNYCKPAELTVYARYTRRGGLDINPYRSTTKPLSIANFRLPRQ